MEMSFFNISSTLIRFSKKKKKKSTLIIIVEIKKKLNLFIHPSSLSILIDILFALHILSCKVFQFYLELFL